MASDINWSVLSALMPRNTISVVDAGSVAFGLDTPESDRDFAGLHVIPLSRFLDFRGHGAETVEHKVQNGAAYDYTSHDIGKFCRLAVAGNPTILECLWAAPRYSTEWSIELRKMRSKFLSKSSLKPYVGYAESQRKRLVEGKSLHTQKGQYNPKWACHYLRLLYAAIHLASTGEVLVRVEGVVREFLMNVKAGHVEQAEVLSKGADLLAQFRVEESRTKLPDAPEIEPIMDFVRKVRKAFEN